MEKFYTIEEGFAEILLDENVYPIIAVEKALANFMNDIYIKIERKDKKILIKITLQTDKNKLEELIGKIYNECLRETLRYNISVETKHLRELIVGRALYTTCIDMAEDEVKDKEQEENKKQEQNQEEFALNEIAVNWFEKNENKEE